MRFEMKYNRLLILLLLQFLFNFVSAQLRYPVVGSFQSKPAQGMAIYGDFAFLMSDGGGCRQFNLKNGKVEKFLNLASSTKNPHVNNACFGIEKFGQSRFPVIYISQCREGGFDCFVESVDSNAILLQTISAKMGDKTHRVIDWVVDCKNKALYAITRVEKYLDSLGSVRNTISKYRLPLLSEGDHVVFSEKDILDSFDVFFPNALQGCKIDGDYLYLVTGFQESFSHRKDAKRAIQVINLKKRKKVKSIDLTYVTTNEPEDIDFYKGKCLLYCGQEGGIYEIKL